MGSGKIMNTKMLIPEPVRKIIRQVYCKTKEMQQKDKRIDLDPKWLTVQKKLAESRKIIDLGCGSNPVQGATVGVDLYIEPKERALGVGPTINVQKMKERGIAFVNARIESILPFNDKEFDFAYSHHVFEHLQDPATACKETMRIAKSGAIITPSLFAELIFGRPYHRWLVMERNNTIFFFRKRPFEDRPFGEHPEWDEKTKKWVINKNTNPFDMLLNISGWYQGGEREMPRLSEILRKHWFSHSPLIECIFLWEDEFKYEIYGYKQDECP
jgi:ubiquinone/menaquinone biosynthesis C-methylase UbiE